jgi:uncharacterized membrane protein
MHWTSTAPIVLAAFMAAMVEFVEALTIVLAVGVVRGWRSTLLGTAAALVVLLALVAALGPALMRIPLQTVQFVVGTLLLLFGLRWLRKAVLRAAGVLALHDEALAFEKETAALRQQARSAGRSIDTLAFTASFKIVMLEGIEVVFIVIAIGAGRALVPAIIGAGLALLAVVVLGLLLHRPLASVPENTLKLGVGILLAAFGTFWVGEGLRLKWPGEDVAILALIALFLIASLGLGVLCRRLDRTAAARLAASAPKPASASGPKPKESAWRLIVSKAVALFIDDGWLAAGIVLWVAVFWLFDPTVALPSAQKAIILSLGLTALLAISAGRRAAR